MAGQNDFLIFDENQDNMLTQENYAIDSDRTDGFQTGLARSNVTNKVLHQTSMMCHAIGECIKDINETATDSGSVSDLKDAIKNALSGDFSRNIGEIAVSAVPLTDAGLHLLDGSLLNGSGIYARFVTYIANLRTDYPDLFTTEALWQQAVTTYGVCGKFVYDSVNNTVRLPKITGIVEGTTDVTALGDLVQAGLPVHTHTRGDMNITGRFWVGRSANAAEGAFVKEQTSGEYSNQNDATDGGHYLFDASRSWTGSTSAPNYSTAIQNSNTVQPQTIKVLYYIVIATSTKTDIEVDVDEIATDLNGKADVDLTNVNNSGTSTGASWAMPSNTYIVLTLGASGTAYVAPANGWFVCICGGDIRLETFTDSTLAHTIHMAITTGGTSLGGGIGYIPVRKNQAVVYRYSTSAYAEIFFVYAEGEV